MRLHFNRIGYSLYGKEQSRRVPSLRAKPGNPGYGFRRARWRDTLENEDDRDRCRAVLREAGLQDERIQTIQERVQEVSDVFTARRLFLGTDITTCSFLDLIPLSYTIGSICRYDTNGIK